MNLPEDPGDRWRTATRRGKLVVGTTLVLAAAGTVLASEVLHEALSPTALQASLEGLGPYAPLVYVALQATQVVLAPIPGQLLAGVGGYVFGGLRATVLSMIGVVVGAVVVFGLVRRVGPPALERLVGEEPVSRFEEFGAENGVVTLFVLFLLPTFPDDVPCAVAGLWDVRLRTFLMVLLVGRTPSFYAVAYAGTSAESGALGRVGVVLGAGAVVALVVYLARDRIRETLTGVGRSVD
jgi:uncharacterized membrane protein YdjX (TVP38/TMEM64 family)